MNTMDYEKQKVEQRSRERYLVLQSAVDRKRELNKNLQQKIRLFRNKVMNKLLGTEFARNIGINARQLSVINRGRENLSLCIKIAKLFLEAMSSIGVPYMPSLGGIKLSPAEMKLWIAIYKTKQLYHQMIIDDLAKSKKMNLARNMELKQNEIRTKLQAKNLELSDIAMEKNSSQSTKESEHESPIDREINKYRSTFRDRILQAKNLRSRLGDRL